MVEARKFLNKLKNITFYKMLGTGAEGGFIKPDFGVYFFYKSGTQTAKASGLQC